MGYDVKQRDTKFFLPADKKVEALAAIKALHEGTRHKGWYAFAWVDTRVVMKATSLEDALREWGYDSTVRVGGDITDLQFARQSAGDEECLFGALAPFVQAGSYMIFTGADGETWRWWFDGRTRRRQEGTVVFPDPTE